MKKLLYILLGLVLVLFSACSNIEKEIQDIPVLSVTFNSEEISVKKGGYTWSTGNKIINADTASPDLIAEEMDGNKIKSQSELTLNFSKKPNNVNVVDWSESKNNIFTYNNEKIIVPKEEGTYVYEIIGEWGKGTVSYVIKVIVKS